MPTLHPLLRPIKPSSDAPFDAVKAAHLLNRAGFGGTPQEIEKVLALGPIDAVDWLLDFPDAPAEEQSQTDVPDLSSIEGYPKNFREIQLKQRGMTPEERQAFRQQLMRDNRQAVTATAAWWLRRMAGGPHPLQEKLTLFWHGHFTTSAKDERAALLMWNQNELLRRNAAGNFRQFVRQISRDPAMLDYLNNQQNRKKAPNENYARELMELFTLGIGHYTEQDIREAARAFTGWAHDGEEYIFRRYDHDDGEKTFFGRKGDLNGDDVIEIILQHPVCAKYIAGKLFRFFAYEEVEPPVVDSLAEQLREARWDLRPLLRTIFTSGAFYGPKAIGSQVKSPIQLVVGTVRQLGIDLPQAGIVRASLNQMGQVPLEPPNVKGWPGGRAWINTSTLFVRYNTAVWLAGGAGEVARQRGAKAGRFRMAMVNAKSSFTPPTAAGAAPAGAASTGPTDAAAVVDYWLDRLIQRPVDDDKKRVLLDALGNRPDDEAALRKMVQLIVSMPEYQLC
ncbi:MAG TPA: DUF1800 domain-containing protein [Tepidisphaeraceae bacterium]|nr:DUF1800 domain-containing protein [Tepidisphaeraceae bacterium]